MHRLYGAEIVACACKPYVCAFAELVGLGPWYAENHSISGWKGSTAHCGEGFVVAGVGELANSEAGCECQGERGAEHYPVPDAEGGLSQG